MDNANKIISFVLGLIVVIVVLLLITGRLGLFKGMNILPVSRGNSATPSATLKKTAEGKGATPTPKRMAVNVVATATPVVQNNNQSSQQKDQEPIKTIPSTGASSDILALMIFGLVGGMFLRKVKISS
jgi:hypothetical protein